MAVTGHKIYVLGNIAYIDQIVDSGEALRYEGLAKDCLPRTKYVDSTDYSFTGFNGLPETTIFAFDDLYDENGDPWADQATLNTWLRDELGKSNGGGSSSNTSVIPYIDIPTYDGNDIPTVPNTFILLVENITSPNNAVDWSQPDLGADVVIADGVANGDVIRITGLTYDSVAPPTGVQQAFIYVESQDNTGLINPQVRRNNIGLNFTFTRTDVGTFTISNFDPTIHFVSDGNQTPNGKLCFSVEEGNVLKTLTLNGATFAFEPSDFALEFGGWIIITKP